MHLYARKNILKYILLTLAAIIAAGSLRYTHHLVGQLTREEKKKVELWAEATRQIAGETPDDINFAFLLRVLEDNETVPVILTDSARRIIYTRNLNPARQSDSVYLYKRLHRMMHEFAPIEIDLPGNDRQYIFYDRSTVLEGLSIYPYVQLGVIVLFIGLAYGVFSASRKAEQGQVWVGLSKETAHQLGTPVSSLLAWSEILKLKTGDSDWALEFEKDLKRLEKIVERFSKIGAKPKLAPIQSQEVAGMVVQYLRTRVSKNVRFIVPSEPSVPAVMANVTLLEWVFENLMKNAIDAMDGTGTITLRFGQWRDQVAIDVSDTGKGIPKSKHRTVFKPGYTTKQRGWGLGLSLVRRIVEEYHDGQVFVLHSEPGAGTTFRILLKKAYE